jgi:hypothetical protein
MRQRGIPGSSFETRLAGAPQDDGVFGAIKKNRHGEESRSAIPNHAGYRCRNLLGAGDRQIVDP